MFKLKHRQTETGQVGTVLSKTKGDLGSMQREISLRRGR